MNQKRLCIRILYLSWLKLMLIFAYEFIVFHIVDVVIKLSVIKERDSTEHILFTLHIQNRKQKLKIQGNFVFIEKRFLLNQRKKK